MKAFRIETRYTYGWADAGWTEGAGDRWRAWRFASMAEAERALTEYFDAVKASVTAENWTEAEQLEVYRIVRRSGRSTRTGR